MTLRMVIKGEDRGAAGAAREGMVGLFRWNGGPMRAFSLA